MNIESFAQCAKLGLPLFCLYNRNLRRVESTGENLPILGRDVEDLVNRFNEWNPSFGSRINDDSNGRQPGYRLCRYSNDGTAYEVRFFSPGDAIRIASTGKWEH